MTLRQKAYKLIDTMTDDNIRILIQLMYRLEPKPTPQEESLDFSRFVTPTEQGQNADENVKDLRADDRMKALRWMQKKHEEMPDDRYAGLDFEKEREKALTEKYGNFA